MGWGGEGLGGVYFRTEGRHLDCREPQTWPRPQLKCNPLQAEKGGKKGSGCRVKWPFWVGWVVCQYPRTTNICYLPSCKNIVYC